MRYREEKWVRICDHCQAQLTGLKGAILGTDSDNYAVFEAEQGLIYAGEDHCWCSVDCLCAWIRAQISKLIREAVQ